jgi:hypothetical protein
MLHIEVKERVRTKRNRSRYGARLRREGKRGGPSGGKSGIKMHPHARFALCTSASKVISARGKFYENA